MQFQKQLKKKISNENRKVEHVEKVESNFYKQHVKKMKRKPVFFLYMRKGT